MYVRVSDLPLIVMIKMIQRVLKTKGGLFMSHAAGDGFVS